MNNVVPLKPEPTFTDNDRLEHLYAAIAFLISHGKINPLALSLRVAQLDGSEVDISLNEVMNQARRVIDRHGAQGEQLQRLRRYGLNQVHQISEQEDDGQYVLREDVQRLLRGA